MISDRVKVGVQQAPHRSLFNALGFTEEEMKKPLIGIVSSYSEIIPGHMNLDKITEAVKLGVAEAGGMPVVVPAIAVCDGIAMGHIGMKYSLVTRDLIADSTECLAKAHGFDGLVMIPNCDKNVPGLLMAAARINIPTIFVSGGPMLARRQDQCGRTSQFRGECLPDMRFLLRHVHRKLDELPHGSHRHGPSRQRNDSGRIFLQNPSCQARRKPDHVPCKEPDSSERYHDP